MKKIVILILLVTMALFVTACETSEATEPTQAAENTDVMEKTADLDEDGDADATITGEVVDGTAEAELVIEMDDQMTDEAKEAIANVDPEEFCQPGSTYTYESAEGNIDSKVIGLTMYEGAEFCQATSQSTIESPIGTITTDSTYYFDATYKEYWVETTVSGAGMPAQTTKVHIVDGVVEE